MRFIGIDPGQSGGLVLLNPNGYVLASVGMPAEETDLWQLLSLWSQDARVDGVKAFLEKVRASPQMSKGSIWTFAQGVGTLRAFLIAAEIPFEEVAPQKWQRFIGVLDKTGARALGDVNITEKKNRHKAKAAELFPNLTITHKIADALLIAEYGRRMMQGFGAELPR